MVMSNRDVNYSGRIFSEEALEAMRLAELYQDIEPDVYILPLDTMSGGGMLPRGKDDR